MDFATISGNGSTICFRASQVMSVSLPATIAASSTRFRIEVALEYRGATCRSASGTGGTRTGGSVAGQNGVWERVFQHLATDAKNEYAMIDSTIVRAHQHSAGALKKS